MRPLPTLGGQRRRRQRDEGRLAASLRERSTSRDGARPSGGENEAFRRGYSGRRGRRETRPKHQSRGGRRGRSARGEGSLGVRADTLLAGSATCALAASASSPTSSRVPSLESSRHHEAGVEKPEQRNPCVPCVLRVLRALRAFPPRCEVAQRLRAAESVHLQSTPERFSTAMRRSFRYRFSSVSSPRSALRSSAPCVPKSA